MWTHCGSALYTVADSAHSLSLCLSSLGESLNVVTTGSPGSRWCWWAIPGSLPATCSHASPVSPVHHGYEQWPWQREAGPRRRQTGRQSHGHHGCHDDQRLGGLRCQRREERRGSDGQGSGKEDPSAAASPHWEEVVTAGERHLLGLWGRVHAHLPSCGSQAHRGV